MKINLIKVLYFVSILSIFNPFYVEAQLRSKSWGISFINLSNDKQTDGIHLKSPENTLTISGSAAAAIVKHPEFVESLVDRMRLCNINESMKPNIFPIYSSYEQDGGPANQSIILGGITQLNIKKHQIFVLARHTLSGKNKISSDVFYKAHPEINGLQLFEVIDLTNSQKLDVLFFANDQETLSSALSTYKNYSKELLTSQEWLSWQYGSNGNQLTMPCSEGNSMVFESDEQENYNGYSGLPRGLKNFASPGSSGSVVWNISHKSNILPFGVVICKQEQPKGSMQDSLMRVLSFEKIINGNIQIIDFEKAQEEITDLQTFPNCTPVDRNGIGVDRSSETVEGN